MMSERSIRRALIVIALIALAAGLAAQAAGRASMASAAWTIGTVPTILALGVSIFRDLKAGRMGVDAVALLSMTAALLLGASLAAIVVAVMYAGGTVLEDTAMPVRSATSGLLWTGHPGRLTAVKDVVFKISPPMRSRPAIPCSCGRGRLSPADGIVLSPAATLDKSALTGEPISVCRSAAEGVRSGTVNAGEAFEFRAAATAGESTYEGIIRLVTAAQPAKSPFMRMADKYALLLLPATRDRRDCLDFSGDPLRALAVLVASTPCPLFSRPRWHSSPASPGQPGAVS